MPILSPWGMSMLSTEPLVGVVMDAKRDKLGKLVELSVELGEGISYEKMTRTHLRDIRTSTLSIRNRLKKRARLIWPPEKGDDLPNSSDESLGVAYRRELGRLEKRRELLLALHNRQKLEVSRLRLAVKRTRQALLPN